MVGIAATMAVTQPKNLVELVLAVGAGGFGALISDIDVETSGSHKEADRITMFSMGVVLTVLTLDRFFETDIMNRVIKNSGYGSMVLGALIFIAICAFGKEQPHRSFMHSFLALLLLCFAMSLVWKKAVLYFAVGFLSHLAIDSFNKKKVRLFYPLKGGVSLGLFRANGTANRAFFIVAAVVTAFELLLFVIRMFHFMK